MTPAEVRARLVTLESMRLMAGRQDPDSKAPRRVYAVTHEGRRKAGAGTRIAPRDDVTT